MYSSYHNTTRNLDTQKIDELIAHIIQDPDSTIQLFSEELMTELINRATNYASDQSLLLEIYAPIKIVGKYQNNCRIYPWALRWLDKDV